MKKERVLKDNGKIYRVYPNKLLYDSDYCYCLVTEDDKTKYLRVDKMINVRVSEATHSCNIDKLPGEQIRLRNKYGLRDGYGKREKVTIAFDKDMMDAVIDYFGENVYVDHVGRDCFRVIVEIVPDLQFFSWIFELGEAAMIEYPLSVAAQMMDMLKERFKAYREEHSSNVYYYRRKEKQANRLQTAKDKPTEPENKE